MTEGQVARVAAALAAVLGARALDWPRAMSRFAEPQDPDFQAINASLSFDRRLWPLRRRAVARPRGDARGDRRDHQRRERDELLGGLDAVAAELERRAASPSSPTTRTSTWRSSGG